jgi:hypothetical protein
MGSAVVEADPIADHARYMLQSLEPTPVHVPSTFE